MKKIKEKFLPIGTVVMLKGGEKRIMITGFCAIEEKDKEKKKVWDYSGCMYPEGFLSSNRTLLFDHEQIETIYHYGFIDEEEEAFKERLNEFVANGFEINDNKPEN